MKKKLSHAIAMYIIIALLPLLLINLIKTEPSTEYKWWENAIGYIVSFALYITWMDYWWLKLIDKYLTKYTDDETTTNTTETEAELS